MHESLDPRNHVVDTEEVVLPAESLYGVSVVCPDLWSREVIEQYKAHLTFWNAAGRELARKIDRDILEAVA